MTTAPHWPSIRRGLGDDSDDENPPIDENPGAPGSDAGGDSGNAGGGDTSAPAVDTSLNPGAPVAAGAQTGTSPGGVTTGNSTNEETGGDNGGGGGGTSSGVAVSTDPTPYIIAGAVVLGVGALGAAWYYKHHKKGNR